MGSDFKRISYEIKSAIDASEKVKLMVTQPCPTLRDPTDCNPAGSNWQDILSCFQCGMIISKDAMNILTEVSTCTCFHLTWITEC